MKNAKRIPNFAKRNASDYMSELGLDDDVEEDIQQEMEVAKEAWAGIVSATNGNMTLDGSLILEERMNADGSVDVNVNENEDDDGNDGNDGVLCRLVTALGTTYSEEEHGVTLRSLACVVNASDISSTGNVSERRELSEDAFIGWYIALLFDENDDEEEDDVNWRDEDDDEDKDSDEEGYDEVESMNANTNIIISKNDNSSTSDDSDIIIGTSMVASLGMSASASASTHASGDRNKNNGGFGGIFGIRSGSNMLDGDRESWKCGSCMISNSRDAVRCVCCDFKAPSKDPQASLEGSGKGIVEDDVRAVISSSAGRGAGAGAGRVRGTGLESVSGISSNGFSFPVSPSVSMFGSVNAPVSTAVSACISASVPVVASGNVVNSSVSGIGRGGFTFGGGGVSAGDGVGVGVGAGVDSVKRSVSVFDSSSGAVVAPMTGFIFAAPSRTVAASGSAGTSTSTSTSTGVSAVGFVFGAVPPPPPPSSLLFTRPSLSFTASDVRTVADTKSTKVLTAESTSALSSVPIATSMPL